MQIQEIQSNINQKDRNKKKKGRKALASIRSSPTLLCATRLLIEVYTSFRENLPPSLTHKYIFKMWSPLPDPGKSIILSNRTLS